MADALYALRKTRRVRPWLFAGLRHALLASAGLLMIAPFILMVSISLKSPGEIFSPEFHLLPQQWHAWENYSTAFAKQPLGRFLLNGALVWTTKALPNTSVARVPEP